MSASGEPLPKGLTPEETAATLQRILNSVQKEDRNRWVEVACAVVLSPAMMASAWCAYQANLWSGVQTFRLAAESKAGRESSKATLAALQTRAFDAAMLINYLQAQTQGNQRLEKILRDRFRPEAKRALEAWLKTDPFNNPAAQEANEASDTYVLLTVAFTSVLFFGGISGTVRSRRLRISFFVIALVLFLVTVIFLGTMPVCSG